MGCVALLVGLGSLFARHGLFGLAGAELLLFGVPLAAAAWWRRDRLGLIWPGRGPMLGGFLVGVSGWAVLGALVLPLQERLAPTPPELEQSLAQVLVGPLPLVLFAVALVPAVCEELLCRGAVALPLARRMGGRWGILISALLFALLHASVYRLAPTLLLGLSFGAIAVRTRSILPSMLAHAVNNAAIAWVTSDMAIQTALDAHHLLIGAIAVIVLALGHILVFLRFSGSK